MQINARGNKFSIGDFLISYSDQLDVKVAEGQTVHGHDGGI